MTSSNLKKLQDLLKDGGGGGDGGGGDGSGGFSGTVATSTDSGFFTPTFGGNQKKKKKVESFVKELVEWVSNELKKEDIRLKTTMPPQNKGDEPHLASDMAKALVPPAISRKDSSFVQSKEPAVTAPSQGDVHPKTATEVINAGTDNLELLRKFEDQDKKEMSQKVGIFNEQGQVLILRDAYSEFWDLPGGRMHYDETFLEALQREVYEETKLPIEHIKFVSSSNEQLGPTMKLVLIYSANVSTSSQPILSEEHRGFEWISEERIGDFNLGVFAPILRFLFHNKKESIQKAEEWVQDVHWDPRKVRSPDVVDGGPKKGLTFLRASEDPNFLAPKDPQHFVPDSLKVHDFHLVGGAVRDKLLGKPQADFDVVTHTPLQQIKDHLEVNGIPHHQTNAGGKSLTYQHNGNFVDVASTEGKPLVDDLARRDFTINSMAEGPDTKLIDPFGGQQDLQQKVLRSPNNDSHRVFEEDPVRMLRAARFVADLGLSPHQSVVDAIGTHREKLSEVPTERVGKEFGKLMTSSNPTKGLEFLREHDLLRHISPDLHAAVGFEQNTPHHRLDVWGHTLETLQHMKSNDLVSNLAALFHDVGKPVTADPTKASFHGHEEAGAQIAKKTLQRLHFPEDTVNRVVRLVDNHMRIHNLPDDAKDAAYNRLRHQMGEDLPLLVDLTRADAMAGNNRDLEYVDRFQTRMGTIKPLPERKDLSPLSGQEIMEHMGLKPGPEIGRFKNLLHDKVIEGELSHDDKESAKKLLDLNKEDTSSTGIAKPEFPLGQHHVGFYGLPSSQYETATKGIKQTGLHPDGPHRSAVTRRLDSILQRPPQVYSFPNPQFDNKIPKFHLQPSAFIVYSPSIARNTNAYDIDDHTAIRVKHKLYGGPPRWFTYNPVELNRLKDEDILDIERPQLKTVPIDYHEIWSKYGFPEFGTESHIPPENIIDLDDLHQSGLTPIERGDPVPDSFDDGSSRDAYSGQDVQRHINKIIGERKHLNLLKETYHIGVLTPGMREHHWNTRKSDVFLQKIAMKEYIEVGEKPPHNEPVMTGPKGGKFYYASYSGDAPKQAINQWFGREDAANILTIAFGTSKEGVSTQIMSAGQDPVYKNMFAVEASIRNSSGSTIGSMYRRFIKETNSAYHTGFSLIPKYQNQGIGSDILENTEQAYQKLGLSHIGLYANDDVGGYAWALQGFDFQDGETLKVVQQFCHIVSKALRTRNFQDLVDQGYEDYSEFSKQHPTEEDLDIMDETIPKLRHAWEFAMLNPSKAPHGQHLGKTIMKNTGWFGRKSLDENSESWKVGEAYRRAKKEAKLLGG